MLTLSFAIILAMTVIAFRFFVHKRIMKKQYEIVDYPSPHEYCTDEYSQAFEEAFKRREQRLKEQKVI